MVASVVAVPKLPPSARRLMPDVFGRRVTMFIAPANADAPISRAAGPLTISILSMSEMLTGKSVALCPVCALLRFMPFNRMAVWSNVPPLVAMSV